MIYKYKPYNEYKNYDLAWLDKLPKHWNLTRTKNIFRLRTEKSGFNHNHELLSIYTHIGVRPRRLLEQKGNKASTTDDYWMVYKGDLIVNKLLAWMGAIGVSNYDGVTSPAYDILKPIQDCNTNYYHYLFRTKKYLQLFKGYSRGIMDMRLRLYFDQFGQIPVIIPPKSEQDHIVNYLKMIEVGINRFIKSKQRLIEVLKEQKQVIINQAVTKGIDPNVKLKPSGVDYLGDIPEHWEARRLRTIATVKPSGVDKNTVDDEIPVFLCNYVDVYKNDYITPELSFMKATASKAEIDNFKLRAGDVLITKDSEDWADIAVPAYVATDFEDVICAYHLAVIRPNAGVILGEYLFRAFSSELIADQFRVSANGITRYGLSQNGIKSAFFPLPPIKEQEKIIEHIKNGCKEIDTAITKAEREIKLIQEYRISLICDVVTGKIDIRDIPVEPVEDIEEVDDLDEIQESEELTELQEVTDADD